MSYDSFIRYPTFLIFIIIIMFPTQYLQSDLDELLNEAKNSEEKAKKAMVDAARLADELRAEQDHAQTQEKLRKALETQIKELQVRLDEAEANALKGGKKAIQKLEQRVRELENELDGEQRRHADAQKNLRKSERRIKELSFQVRPAILRTTDEISLFSGLSFLLSRVFLVSLAECSIKTVYNF